MPKAKRTVRADIPKGMRGKDFGLSEFGPMLGYLHIREMSAEISHPQSSGDLLRNSTLYREFQAEREEILKHKWIESEKLGYDIGFERALLDWIRKHRDRWRAERRAQIASANPPAKAKK